jgi:hypothetical protein
MQRDPAFRESSDVEESNEEASDPLDDIVPRDDDEADLN